MSFGEWFFGDGGEEFFERHAGESDFGVGQGSVGIVIGIGFGASFGLLSFAEFEELFCDAHFSHEFGDFGTGTVEEAGSLFNIVNLFGSKAGTTIGEELFLDVGAFGPFPEFLFFAIGGGGLTESEPVTLDLEVVVCEGGTTKARDVVGELAEGSPLAFGIGFGVDVAGHSGVLELGPEEKFGSDAMSAMNAMREFVRVASCVFRDLIVSVLGLYGSGGVRLVTSTAAGNELEELGGVVLEEPVAEAALFPFGEVLFGDGTAVEFSREDGFDFGEGVEPGQDRFVRLMVVKTEVELFAEVVRETGDFADASCSVHNILF
jgi:hypothetical protein